MGAGVGKKPLVQQWHFDRKPTGILAPKGAAIMCHSTGAPYIQGEAWLASAEWKANGL